MKRIARASRENIYPSESADGDVDQYGGGCRISKTPLDRDC